MQIPLLDLKAQYAKIKGEILAAMSEVLESQRCIGGPKVEELEKRIAEISDCKYAVGTTSGTDAILNTLMSLEIGASNEVITTPFTFFATVGCIARVGAKPVFVDIDPKTYNIDSTRVAEAVTEKTKAIMPVHLYGQMADMEPVMKVAKQHNIAVIEDAAQSITSTYKGRKAGSIGTRKNAAYYNKKFEGTVVQVPYINPDCVTIYNQYVIRVPRRDEVVAHLKENNIGCEIYYPVTMHLQKCFAYLGYREGDFPEAEKAAKEVMALPIYPELTDEMKDCVAETILSYLG